MNSSMDCIGIRRNQFQTYDPGIRVGSGVGLKEKSGSDLLLKALREGGFPAVYHAIGTNQNDTTIFLEIGMKPH